MSSSGFSDSEGEGPIPSAGTPACHSTSSQHHDDNAFRIRFPSQTTYQCPVCELWYNILPSLRRHVKKSHPAYLYQELFACDVCGYETGTLKSVNSHVRTQHGTVNPPEAPNGAFQCPHCVMRFPSKVSCSQHVRGRHMEEACQARAAAAASTTNEKRKPWTQEERASFEAALKLFGPSSNVAIAKAIGSRTAAQVGVFKRSFLLKNPNWPHDTSVPPSPCPSTACRSDLSLNLNLNSNSPALPSCAASLPPVSTLQLSSHAQASIIPVPLSPPHATDLSLPTRSLSSPPHYVITVPSPESPSENTRQRSPTDVVTISDDENMDDPPTPSITPPSSPCHSIIPSSIHTPPSTSALPSPLVPDAHLSPTPSIFHKRTILLLPHSSFLHFTTISWFFVCNLYNVHDYKIYAHHDFTMDL